MLKGVILMNNFKKQCEEIQVPDDIDFVLKKAIRKGRNGLITKRLITFSIVLCVLFTSLIGTGYAYPPAAEAFKSIPFIGSIFQKFTDNNLKIASLNGLTHFPEQQQTRDGVTVTLKEYYFDRSNFNFGIVVKGRNPYNFETHFTLYYNNKPLNKGSGGGSTEITKDSFYRLTEMSLTETPPDKSTLKLVGTDNTGKIKKFEYDIPIDYSKVDPLTTEIKLMKNIKQGNRTIIVKNIIFTPVATTISYEYTCPKDEHYSMQLFNENGRLVQSKGNVGSNVVNGDFTTYSSIATFDSLNTVPEHLTLNIIDSSESKILDNVKDILLSTKLDLKTIEK